MRANSATSGCAARFRPTCRLLGSPDFQSLSDLHQGYELVRRVRLVPFTFKNVTSLAAIVLFRLRRSC